MHHISMLFRSWSMTLIKDIWRTELWTKDLGVVGYRARKFGDHGVQEFGVRVYLFCIVFCILSAFDIVLGFIDENANEQSKC